MKRRYHYLFIKKGIFRYLFLGKLDDFVVCSCTFFYEADAELSGVSADRR